MSVMGESMTIEFAVGDYVKKVTGEYQIYGEVRSVFQKQDGATRLVVEHKAEGGGSFLHIYGPNNLVLASRGLEFDMIGG